MARASTGKGRGVGSRIGWPLKIFVGILLVLLVLLVLNAFALNNETKSADLNVPGAKLVNTTSGPLQVLDTGTPAGQRLREISTARKVRKSGVVGSFSATTNLLDSRIPIVLIHGSAGAINWWDDLIPLLKPDHRVIAIDLLGYGGSEKPDSDYSMETQGNLVSQVLTRLGVKDAVLVGHSLGGSVVTSVAEQSPELVSGLVLIDSGPDRSYGGLSGAAKASQTPILGQALWRLAPDFMVRKNLSQGFAPGYDVPDKYVQDVREMTYPAYKKSYEGVEDYTDQKSLPDRLSQVGKPLLVIFGEEDQIYDAREALSAYAAIPGAMTHLIPKSGHSPQIEAPEQTARAINNFTWTVARTKANQQATKALQAKKRAAAAKERAAARAKKQAARAKAKKSRQKSGKAKQQAQ
ncbi:MAG TPA: alpha/beta hydrolase [Solirubrobacterales bacterium]|nr:alpha/beta hydrolase [Solirubrobacterales bacterium]HRV59113.1 alpha/beta hydrolase [Solirubrobacterales bacterium]